MRKIPTIPAQCYQDPPAVFIWHPLADLTEPWFDQPGPLERMSAPFGAHELLRLPPPPLAVLTSGVNPL